MPDWQKLRDQFPALKSWTYLDTAAFGQVPRSAAAAMAEHMLHRDQTASSRFLSWFDDMDVVRDACAQLIHCTRDDIAFVPSASTGLAWLMNGLDWRPGDEVLTLDGEFPNQLYQGPSLKRCGVTFRTVKWEDFYSSISPSTRLVLLSTVNYATGFRPPLEEVSTFLKNSKVLLYVDGTQSVGALRFDAEQVRPAMLCVDAYKWMLSPNGAGFVYVDRDIRSSLHPSVVGWRSDNGWRSVASLNHGDPQFSDAAERFEGGMIPFPSLYAMGAVVKLLLGTGTDTIEARVMDLANKTRRVLSELGGEVNSDNSQIVTARIPGFSSNDLVTALKEQRVLISARHGRLRISCHFYNNEEDIELLRRALLSQMDSVPRLNAITQDY